MKFGIKLPNSGPFASAENLQRVITACEGLGFDSIWVHDHLSWSVEDAEHHYVAGAWEAWGAEIVPNVFEPLVTLSFAAGLTSRILLGTSVVVLPLRHPVWFAKMTATLDQLSSGRMIVGVGAGGGNYVAGELASIALADRMAQRGAVVDEWIDVIRGIWRAEGQYSADLPHISVRNATVFPKPHRPGGPPLWYGGSSRMAMRRAATRGDGWIQMYSTAAEIAESKKAIGALSAETEAARVVTMVSEHWLAVNENAEAAWDSAFSTLTGESGRRGAAVAAPLDVDRERARNIFGDVATVAARIAEYRAAGVDHLILRIIAHSMGDLIRSLELARLAVERSASIA